MTPAFDGLRARYRHGPLRGRRAVMQDEQNKGLRFHGIARCEPAEHKRCSRSEKTRRDALAQAYTDNLVLDYAGLRVDALSAPQKRLFREVVAEYVFNMDEGHGALRMKEIEAHLDETYFAWLGTTGPESVFYYRIQSPVILIDLRPSGADCSRRTTRPVAPPRALCGPHAQRQRLRKGRIAPAATSNVAPMPLTGTFTEVVSRRTEAFARAS